MVSRLARGVGFLAVAVILQAQVVPAADAVLFKGGDRAILADPLNEDRILDADLRTGKAVEFDAAALGAPAGFRPQAISRSGFLLGTSGTLLMACDPAKKKTVTVYKARPGVVLGELAYNPKDGSTLVRCSEMGGEGSLADGAAVEPGEGDSYHSPLIYIGADPGTAGFVFCRRVPRIDGMAFAPDGTLYLTMDGDLWEGVIEPNDLTDNSGPMRWVLSGSRVAPVAVRETSIGTPASTGAREVAVVGDRLYLHSHRIGGSGMGDLYSVARMPETKSTAPDENDLVAYARRAARIFASLQFIREYPRPPALASTTDSTMGMWAIADREAPGGPVTTVFVVDSKTRQSRSVKLTRD